MGCEVGQIELELRSLDDTHGAISPEVPAPVEEKGDKK